VVATPAFVPSGAQQWMCAATSFDVKPPNVAPKLPGRDDPADMPDRV
jgi:hypothetical protein